MHMHIKALLKVSSRYAPSRVLSFDLVHVFKALQLIEGNGHVSRASLCSDLALGEGVVKTLIKHLKMEGLITTSNRGTQMTPKGRAISSELLSCIPEETTIPNCSIALGKFNHAVLLRDLGYSVRSGIEQRDAAIKVGAIGATTLIFKDDKFVMPGTNHNPLKKEPEIYSMLLEKLKPQAGDVVIIGSADTGKRIAELAAKNAALMTVMAHEKHDYR
jgi:hypothetical protein